MPFTFENLDAKTRTQMTAEINSDISAGKLYLSNRLSPAGRTDYPELLRQAAEANDDSWLANELRGKDRLNEMEERRKPKGGTTMARARNCSRDASGG